jgi:hypothetical protein
METYFVESQHMPQECLCALDEILAKGTGFLAKYEWRCMTGGDTGYPIIEARSESEGRAAIPAFRIGKTRVVKLEKITPEEIREFHRKTA